MGSPITLLNIGDPGGNADWSFDGSNFLTGASGVGITIGSPTGGDIANSINVAGNYYINGVSLSATFAPVASPTFTGTATVPTADITTLNATTLNAGGAYLTSGGKNILTQRALTNATGVGSTLTTTSTTFVMAGWGATAKITPEVSGTVLVLLGTQIESTSVSTTVAVNICYGTGTAPAQNAALTGTELLGTSGLTISYSGGIAIIPQTIPVAVSGLTIGTAYWFDFAAKVVTGAGNAIVLGGGVAYLAEV